MLLWLPTLPAPSLGIWLLPEAGKVSPVPGHQHKGKGWG